MDALVLIPVGALLVAASLRFEKAAGQGLLCGMSVMLVFVLFLGVRALVPDETVFFCFGGLAACASSDSGIS